MRYSFGLTRRFLTCRPTGLLQWLLSSWCWTALCAACVAAAWHICAPLAGGAGGGWRVFVVAVIQVWATINLVERAVGSFDQLYRQARPASAQWLRAVARTWWLVLGVVLALGLAVDALLALLTICSALDGGSRYDLE